MPFNGGGTFVRVYNWIVDKANAVPITASRMDGDANDFASALTDCITRDGQSPATADLPMAGHGLTGMRQAAAAGEPMEFAQGQALIAAAGGSTRNALQNPSFTINQRAVSGSISLAAGAYGHDRWKGGASGASYAVAASGADVQATIGSGSLVQVVAGADVTSATMTLSQAGNAQARVYAQGSAAPAFAACPITVTTLMPGMAAIVEFSTGTVLQPQLEVGSTVHGYARRAIAAERSLCQAYFENIPFSLTLDAYVTSPRLPFVFKSTKAAIPTVTVTITSSINLSGTFVPNISVDGMAINFGASNNSVTAVGNAAVSCEP